MTVSLRSKPSTAKAWALTITPDANGITMGAGPVRWFGERFDVPETFVPCVYSGEPADYRIALCRTPDGPRLVLVTRTEDGEDVPADCEPVVDLARWRLAAPGDTCESVTVHVTQRTASVEMGDPESVLKVGNGPVIPAETPERAAKRAKRTRIREINGKPSPSLVERIERLELLAGIGG